MKNYNYIDLFKFFKFMQTQHTPKVWQTLLNKTEKEVLLMVKDCKTLIHAKKVFIKYVINIELGVDKVA